MKRIIFIIFISVILILGAQQLENGIVSFAESIFLPENSMHVTEHECCVTKPSCEQQPLLFSPLPSPETKPESYCLHCGNSRVCQNCDGLGIEFGKHFGISSGYGIDTLMDRVCFMCDGLGVCSACA